MVPITLIHFCLFINLKTKYQNIQKYIEYDEIKEIYCDILKQADQICDELKRNSVLKTLLFPTDMGETFKIMLVSNKTFRNSFDINDIRHKL